MRVLAYTFDPEEIAMIVNDFDELMQGLYALVQELRSVAESKEEVEEEEIEEGSGRAISRVDARQMASTINKIRNEVESLMQKFELTVED